MLGTELYPKKRETKQLNSHGETDFPHKGCVVQTACGIVVFGYFQSRYGSILHVTMIYYAGSTESFANVS
jgi:hypothetical protein